MNPFQTFVSEEIEILARIPHEKMNSSCSNLLRKRAWNGGMCLFGNGGSASTASHFACDLGRGTIRQNKPRFRVTALHDNLATFSAYANDKGYERVFAEPLINLAEPGDIAIAFSTSGNSPNLPRAAEEATARGLATVGLIGIEGGGLKNLVDLSIVVPSRNMGQSEDAHLILSHAVCQALTLNHS